MFVSAASLKTVIIRISTHHIERTSASRQKILTAAMETLRLPPPREKILGHFTVQGSTYCKNTDLLLSGERLLTEQPDQRLKEIHLDTSQFSF